MDFERLDAIAARFMKHRRVHTRRETGSVYYHGARVGRGVLQLRGMVTADDSHDEILRCAAMFHDIGKGFPDHARYGALIAREALKDELAPDELRAVARLIAAHDDKRPDETAHDIWTRLLQDADVLDHAGTYEIWMSCNYYAYRQQPMEMMEEWYLDGFEPEMARLRTRLNFDVSKGIFDAKVDFVREFARRYRVERTGEYVIEG